MDFDKARRSRVGRPRAVLPPPQPPPPPVEPFFVDLGVALLVVALVVADFWLPAEPTLLFLSGLPSSSCSSQPSSFFEPGGGGANGAISTAPNPHASDTGAGAALDGAFGVAEL